MALAAETVTVKNFNTNLVLNHARTRNKVVSAVLVAGSGSTYVTGGVTPTAAAISSMGLRSITNIIAADADGYMARPNGALIQLFKEADSTGEMAEVANAANLAAGSVTITITAEGPPK